MWIIIAIDMRLLAVFRVTLMVKFPNVPYTRRFSTTISFDVYSVTYLVPHVP